MLTSTTNYQNALASYRAGCLDLSVEISGYSRTFTRYKTGGSYYPWIEEVGDFSYTINDTDGGADQGTFSFIASDILNQITADFPGFVFEGKTVTVKSGLPGLAYADWTTVFVGYIDTVTSENDNLSYSFSCLDMTGKLSQIVFQTGNDGSPTSASNFRTLNGHPLDLLLDILLNQVKLPASLVNVTAIQAYRDGPYAGMQMRFELDQPVAAHDFIVNQLLKPLGCYMFVGNGQITVTSFFPIDVPVAVKTFGPASWTGIPTAEQASLINYIQWQFDKDDSGGSGNYNSSDLEEYTASLARYGINNVGELTITADGMRSALQGYFIAAVVSYMIFLQYGLKALKFDSNSADCQWNMVLVESGDFVYVTHPEVPDRAAGVMGMTNKLFRVLNKSINWTEGIVNFTLIDVSYLQSFGFYKIAPDTIAAYASESTANKAKYMFLCNGAGQYSNTDPAHILG
jgi:hypothetical protein